MLCVSISFLPPCRYHHHQKPSFVSVSPARTLNSSLTNYALSSRQALFSKMARICFALALLLLRDTEAFTSCKGVTSISTLPTFVERTTLRPLYAEESESETETKKDKEADILSSPAFLKRKLEVLGTDIQQAEDRTQAAKEKLEAGKEEWGPQIVELEIEVSEVSVFTKSECRFFELRWFNNYLRFLNVSKKIFKIE
jgi:hypothetical protein